MRKSTTPTNASAVSSVIGAFGKRDPRWTEVYTCEDVDGKDGYVRVELRSDWIRADTLSRLCTHLSKKYRVNNTGVKAVPYTPKRHENPHDRTRQAYVLGVRAYREDELAEMRHDKQMKTPWGRAEFRHNQNKVLKKQLSR